ERSEREAFNEHFPRDAAPAGAERSSNPELLPPSFRPYEQQIRHVRARDQEYEPQGPHHDPQRCADVSNDLLLQRMERRRDSSVLKECAIDSWIRRPRIQPDAHQARDIGVGLLDGDAGFEPRDSLIAKTSQK